MTQNSEFKGPKYYYGLSHSGRKHTLSKSAASFKASCDAEKKNCQIEHGVDCDGNFYRARRSAMAEISTVQ